MPWWQAQAIFVVLIKYRRFTAGGQRGFMRWEDKPAATRHGRQEVEVDWTGRRQKPPAATVRT